MSQWRVNADKARPCASVPHCLGHPRPRPSSMWAVVYSQSASDTRHARSAPASLSHSFACHTPAHGSFSDAYGLKTLGTPALLARLKHSPCPCAYSVLAPFPTETTLFHVGYDYFFLCLSIVCHRCACLTATGLPRGTATCVPRKFPAPQTDELCTNLVTNPLYDFGCNKGNATACPESPSCLALCSSRGATIVLKKSFVRQSIEVISFKR
jgi:hypothetical protein